MTEIEFASLDATHDVSNFVSGEDSIDNWLKRHALTQQSTGSARTFVLLEPDSPQVWGYYALTVASVEREQVTKSARSGLPQSFPIPAVLLARMGRDEKRRSQGYGTLMVANAALRTLSIAEQAGVRLLIVHALNEKAKQFYLALDFQPSPIDDRLLMLSMQDLMATFVDAE